MTSDHTPMTPNTHSPSGFLNRETLGDVGLWCGQAQAVPSPVQPPFDESDIPLQR
jgi:hypothetical protein